MNLSNFYARIIGFYLVIMSIGILLKPQQLQIFISQMSNASVTMSLGIFGLILGLVLVVSHQVWRGWPIIITILGYWSVIKGVIIIFYPEWILKMLHIALSGNNFYIGIGFDLVLGLVLLFCSYKLSKS